MNEEEMQIDGKAVRVYAVPAGPVNLVFAIGGKGLVGCGAIDVGALQGFGYPAARVRPSAGPSIRTIDDLLAGEVKEVNGAAAALGIAVGMSGRAALALLA